MKSPALLKKSAVVAIIWVVISLCAAIAIAYLGRMVLAPELLPDGMQKMVFITFARGLLPSVYCRNFACRNHRGVNVHGGLAAFSVASSSFTSDIYKPVIKKNASDNELLWVGRIVVLAVSVVAYFIASSKGSGARQAITDMVENAWGLFGAAFGPVVILFTFLGNALHIKVRLPGSWAVRLQIFSVAVETFRLHKYL